MPAFWASCSTIGPSASAGKKVSPPTITITPIDQADEQAAGGRERAGRCRDRFLGGERAGNRHGRDDHPEPADNHRDRAGEIVEQRVAVEPGESGTVVAGLRDVSVQHLGEAVRSGIVHRGDGGRHHHGDGGPAEIHQRQDQDGEHRHLDFLRLDLLADIFGRAPDHQAGDEDRDDDEQQHAVHAGADAAEDDLAELDVDERNHAAERGEGIVHGVDRAARRVGGDHREQRRGDDAEADFLAFHIAAGEAERVERVVAVRFGGVAGNDAGKEQDAHHGEEWPSLGVWLPTMRPNTLVSAAPIAKIEMICT